MLYSYMTGRRTPYCSSRALFVFIVKDTQGYLQEFSSSISLQIVRRHVPHLGSQSNAS